VSLGLSACTSMSDATYKTLKAAFGATPEMLGQANSSQPINPAFRTMRITTAGTQATLVLGEIEQSPSGSIEVWFSAQREVIRIQDGRIVSTSGLRTNWVRSDYKPIGTKNDLGGSWRLTRDIAPGWTYGLVIDIKRVAVSEMPRALGKFFTPALQSKSGGVLWVSESPIDPDLRSGQPWQTAYFARTVQGQVLAGYQCLDAELCLAWEKLQR